jgi:hypothetical protein
MRKLLLLLLLAPLLSFGQFQKYLTEKAEVSLLTVGTGPDLYSLFGHTAIRVKDPVTDLDLAFNYGTFNFDEDFYFRFTMGQLNYRMSIEPYQSFTDGYAYENRWVIEQKLNMTVEQKQLLWDLLIENFKPENRYYLYDFFYDNCSTRPRDIIEKSMGDALVYNFNREYPDSSYRNMIDKYLVRMDWSDVGIDLGLGMPCDVVATEYGKCFLPDYLMFAYDGAKIKTEDGKKPFVTSRKMVVGSEPLEEAYEWLSPFNVTLLILMIGLLLSFKPTSFVTRVFDTMVFSIAGLVGWLVFFLWFITDHKGTIMNMNMIWAIPMYFPLGFWLLAKRKRPFIRRLVLTGAVLNTILLIGWPYWPQLLNEDLIALILFLTIRGYLIGLSRTPVKAALT